MSTSHNVWLDSFTPLEGGAAVPITAQNRWYIDGEIEQVKCADEALQLELTARAPDLIATPQQTVIVAEQSETGRRAIEALYLDIAYGQILDPSYLQCFLHAQLPSPLLKSRPISAEQQLRCQQL